MFKSNNLETIKCECGSEHMHPAKLLLMAPISDDYNAMFYNIDIKDASIKEKYFEKTGHRNREASFLIKYVCESCHEILCFGFYFHKGQIEFFTEFEEDKNEKHMILEDLKLLTSQ